MPPAAFVLYNLYNGSSTEDARHVARKSFGQYFKHLRIKRGITLRAFCQENDLDPGNMSRLERGLLPPPTSEGKLAEYATALGLKPGSDEWYEFFDRAAAERGRIPHDILSDKEVLGKLPIVFRTLRGEKVTRSKLAKLVEKIRKA